MTRFPKFTRRAFSLLALVLVTGSFSTVVSTDWAHAEKYQSRLNSLLLKKNDLYLPTRLVLGEEARFVVKAPAGNLVKILVSAKSEGYVLPNGTSLSVGEEVQELTGTVPANGVLELKLPVPKDPTMEGKVVYVAGVVGPSEEALTPIDLIDSTGRRTEENALVIVKPVEAGGPSIMPSMPGLSPQVFNQLTTMSEIYGKGDNSKKQLLDTGDINRDRAIDQNPFVNRGLQPGINGR
jgi:hypothetical protein